MMVTFDGTNKNSFSCAGTDADINCIMGAPIKICE